MVDLGTTFKIQWAPKSFPKSTPGAKKLEKKTSVRLIVAGPGNGIIRESIPIDFWMDYGRVTIDLGSIWMDCWSMFCNLLLNC